MGKHKNSNASDVMALADKFKGTTLATEAYLLGYKEGIAEGAKIAREEREKVERSIRKAVGRV